MAWKPPKDRDYPCRTREELYNELEKSQKMIKRINCLIPPTDDELSPIDLGTKYADVFGHITCVCIDLSGTLHVGDQGTEFAVESLQRLRNLGLTIRFVTNTTKESKRLLLERLRTIGFTIEDNELFTSLMACQKYIKENNINPMYLVDNAALEDLPATKPEDCANGVVVGLSPDDFSYGELNHAFRLLDQGARLIAIHKGKYQETKSGLSLGPGPFVRALEYATGQEAFVVGKPEKTFFHAAVEMTGCEPSKTVMIGDDVKDDVLGAIEAGMKGILVQTGKYRSEDENRIRPTRPNFIARSFASAVRCIEAAISVKCSRPVEVLDINSKPSGDVKSTAEKKLVPGRNHKYRSILSQNPKAASGQNVPHPPTKP